MTAFCATICYKPLLASLLLIGQLLPNFQLTEAQVEIGVCNGQVADNLPSDTETVALYQKEGIKKMRLYAPNHNTLKSLSGTDIQLMLGVANQDIQNFAQNTAQAKEWVDVNVLSYPTVNIKTIAVGNEVDPSDSLAPHVLLAMSNIYDAICASGLKDRIQVSTAISAALVSNPYPPSTGSFNGNTWNFMNPIVKFLENTKNPLLLNAYPYSSLLSDPENVGLPYALFATTNGVIDGTHKYTNIFDAIVDATYSAVEKAGGSNVKIIVSESGWPSAGNNDASTGNAGIYYGNLINHVKGGKGTPKRPEVPIETYLFAMYDEYQKPGAETEKHFGIHFPNGTSKYTLSFN